jgi:hypothetical protein
MFPIAEDILQAVVCVCWNIAPVPTLTRLNSNQAYSYSRSVRHIVTGVAEKGSESVIRYWIQEPFKRHAESGSQETKEQVQGMVIPRYTTFAMTN